ncbi:MAG: leucyl/phenylalanyl-tRNA--protein transferase, partial [Oligoflexia bacterium]|nr:leucyl/phenylalanyl-tRNA--protein transferase [Oligoflexia bacterium]
LIMIKFPPVEYANEQGLLAVGGDLSVESLLAAYTAGIFPWPIGEDFPLTWFAPDPRAILFIKDFVIPKSMQKILKKTKSMYEITVSKNFYSIIEKCANVRRKQSESNSLGLLSATEQEAIPKLEEGPTHTWITRELMNAYVYLFNRGYAYSIEVYESEHEIENKTEAENKSEKQKLVGGLYGVFIGGMFTGESMFHLKDNVSKMALIFLAQKLKELEIEWIDIQMLTPTLKNFGATEIKRDYFMQLLREALKKNHNPNILSSF